MKDDLLDYGDADIGKPTGIDLKEKKLTLPIIYTLNQADKSTRDYIINSIKNHNTNKKRIAEVIDYVNAHGGIEYTKVAMQKFKNDALQILEEVSDSPFKQNLRELVDYVIDRTK
jgi:octaprenyl-diphosphate synthase